MVSRQELPLDPAEREILVKRLLVSFDSHRTEVDATDCSRAAWLSISIKDLDAAKEWTKLGLELDSDNPYCQRLATRLSG
jgi:hypothetical protein